MTKTQQLIDRIKTINAKQYIKKPDKNFIKENLELIQPVLTKDENTKIKLAYKSA